MKQAIADVTAFHRACDVPVLAIPQFPSDARVELRKKLINEEYRELKGAIYRRDLVAVADAIADLNYVLIGTALEFGIPLDRVWDEVQRSNMAKVDQVTGKVIRRADGKILKPEGWQQPQICRILYGSE